ncbi:MAG: WecB/TagA/CpsF family glycosyltransferase [Pirellulaceae bacterium]
MGHDCRVGRGCRQTRAGTFFLGAAPGVAQAAAAELTRQFPALQVAGCCSPPFRQLTAAERSSCWSTIRTSRTDILLVAFGQPKGELWDPRQPVRTPRTAEYSVGASFDFLAGTARRAPAVWQWLGRRMALPLSDPRRLGPRYARNLLFFGNLRLQIGLSVKRLRGNAGEDNQLVVGGAGVMRRSVRLETRD